MRSLLVILLVVVVGIAGWMLFSPMRGEAGGVGINTLVENDVTTASAGQDAWKPAVVGADVFFGDRIVTAAESRLEMRLLDRSNLSVGSNARLTIDRFVYDPSRNAAGAMVSVLTGAFRYASDEGKPEQVSFRTPGATIGIRGTVIEGVVGPEAVALIAGMTDGPDLSLEADSTAVIILRSGAADVRAGGQTVVLDRPGQAVILTRRQVSATFAVTPETTQQFEALLPPTPSAEGSAPPPPGTSPPTATGPVAPPVTTAPPLATPPTRLRPRDADLRPQRPIAAPTGPIGQGPTGPQRAGPTGPNTRQPAPTGPQGAQPQAGLPQGSQPQAQQGAQQLPAGNQQGTQTPPAGTAPGAAPAAAPATTKPTDGGVQALNDPSQPSQTPPGGDRPAGGNQPSATPPASRPIQPSGARPTRTPPQTQQPRQQPVAPGGGSGPRRN